MIAELDDDIKVDYSSVSVQDLYRPVVMLGKNVPGVPPRDKNHPDFIWWKDQINRCLNGWIAPNGVYLNGYLYFYLNFIKFRILDPETDQWSHDRVEPLYRDNDHRVLDIIWSNTARDLPIKKGEKKARRSKARNHIQAKPRGIGWTLYTLLGVEMWTFLFRPQNPVGNAYADDTVMKKERTLFQDTWVALHDIFKRWKGATMEIINNSKDEISVGEKVRGEKINRIHNRCLFHQIGSDSAGVYKGDRMELCVAVEAGKWKGNSLKNYVSENTPSVKLGNVQWGMFLIGGTSNAIIVKSTQYKEMFDNPKSFDATADFTPVTKVLQGFIDYHTGRSLEEEALAHVLEFRESIKEDTIRYQQELVENPLNPDEAFIPTLQLAYKTAIINLQIAYVKQNHLDHYWRRGFLEYIKDINGHDTGDVEFIENAEGNWEINLEGLPNKFFTGLHFGAIDDVFKSKEPNAKVRKEDSRNSMIIYRKYTAFPGFKSDMPVAVYLGRNPDLNTTFEEFYKGMLFYDIEQTLYEYNSDAFPNFLKLKKAAHRLYYIGTNTLPGIAVKSPQKIEMTGLCSEFIAEGRLKNVTHLGILEALLLWGGPANTDVGSAWHLVLMMLYFVKERTVELAKSMKALESKVYIIGKAADSEEDYNRSTAPGTFYVMGRRSA